MSQMTRRTTKPAAQVEINSTAILTSLIHMSEKEAERIMQEVDLDKSGTIDYNEFILAALNRQKVLNKEKLEATFKMFDKDGNGKISADEIRSILGNTNEKSALDAIINDRK